MYYTCMLINNFITKYDRPYFVLTSLMMRIDPLVRNMHRNYFYIDPHLVFTKQKSGSFCNNSSIPTQS